MSERILKAQYLSVVFYADTQVTVFLLFDMRKTSKSAERANEKQATFICP